MLLSKIKEGNFVTSVWRWEKVSFSFADHNMYDVGAIQIICETMGMGTRDSKVSHDIFLFLNSDLICLEVKNPAWEQKGHFSC